MGLVIEGGALAVALTRANQATFLALCSLCRAVVCCRVSPMQKAQVGHQDPEPHLQPQWAPACELCLQASCKLMGHIFAVVLLAS